MLIDADDMQKFVPWPSPLENGVPSLPSQTVSLIFYIDDDFVAQKNGLFGDQRFGYSNCSVGIRSRFVSVMFRPCFYAKQNSRMFSVDPVWSEKLFLCLV